MLKGEKMKNNSGFSLVIGLLIVLVFGAVGFAGWFVWKSNNKDVVLNSYEECVNQEGAVIQESYPEVCIYKDQSFVNPSQKVDTGIN